MAGLDKQVCCLAAHNPVEGSSELEAESEGLDTLEEVPASVGEHSPEVAVELVAVGAVPEAELPASYLAGIAEEELVEEDSEVVAGEAAAEAVSEEAAEEVHSPEVAAAVEAEQDTPEEESAVAAAVAA